MAKKKKERESPYSEPRRAVRLYLTLEEHQKVRQAAALADMPMSEYARRAVLKASELEQNRSAK